MKKIQYIIAMAGVAFLAQSCNDGFLDRAPLDKISDASFWKTTGDLQLYLNEIYDRDDLLAQESGWGSIGPYGWDGSNGADTQTAARYNTRMNSEETIPDSGGGWGTDDWKSLRMCNYFLENYSRVEALTSADAVKPYTGEALFFRSLFYFNKVRRFGAVPWAETTISIDSKELFAARIPRNEAVTKILADLDRAIECLPARGSGAWTGRVTKEVAMALAARVALYEGTWEKYHAGTEFAAPVNESAKFLEKAAAMSGALMAMAEANGFPALSLTGDGGAETAYRDLFNQENYTSNKEVIFWRQYANGVINSIWDRYSGNGAGRGATKNLVDSYLGIDGNPITPGSDDSSLKALAAGRDPRLQQTVQINDGKHYRWLAASPTIYFVAPSFDGWDAEESCPTGYQTYKGHNFRYNDARPAGQGLQALIYFRYGETLLIHAEAKAELGTLTQADLDRSINLLRDRAGMPHMTLASLKNDPNFEFSDLTPAIQEVRRERKVELALEGFRVDDIMRWAAADELIVGKIPVGAKLAQFKGFKFADQGDYAKPDLSRQKLFDERVADLVADENGYIKVFKNVFNGGTQGYKFDVKRDYLYPIPTNQLTLNPALGQNPGWAK